MTKLRSEPTYNNTGRCTANAKMYSDTLLAPTEAEGRWVTSRPTPFLSSFLHVTLTDDFRSAAHRGKVTKRERTTDRHMDAHSHTYMYACARFHTQASTNTSYTHTTCRTHAQHTHTHTHMHAQHTPTAAVHAQKRQLIMIK